MSRSLFLQGPGRTLRLGQWGDIAAAAVSAGVEVYKAEKAEDMAEDRLEFEEAQAARAAAREQEALRMQKELIQSAQAQKAAEAGGTSGEILGMKQGTFFAVAGVGLGAAVLLGALMMRS